MLLRRSAAPAAAAGARGAARPAPGPGPAAGRALAGAPRPPATRRSAPLRAEAQGKGKGGGGAGQGQGQGKGKGRKKKAVGPYSSTVLLPATSFGMRANAKVREPELQAWWASQRVYERLSREAAGPAFTLHDGPPYANGDLHIGHALNKVLKDFIGKYMLLQGRKAKYVPGWDCHGLPIELKVLQSLDSKTRRGLTPATLRAKAREFALETVGRQREQFRRYGVWGDWEEPYLTLNPEYEAAQLGVFGRMFLKGHIYRGEKPVHWSPSSRTALAEAELEYPAGHVSQSVYVALPVAEPAAWPEAVPAAARPLLADAALAVWTTTPWTMPANAAVAVNPNLAYCVCAVGDAPEAAGGAAGLPAHLVVAEGLVAAVAEKLGAALAPVATLRGAELEGVTYRHPLAGRVSPVVLGGDYITTETGTGLVHTAPGHGAEDYLTGLKYGLPLYSPVDDAGKFTADAGGEFEGLSVLGDGNDAVIAALEAAGALLKREAYEHKYPYDWRTKKPTIFRATSQWFASVDGFKEEALQAIAGVRWIPASGEKRITSMTAGRNDWCISRQRSWGVPIPVFYDRASGEPLLTEETLAHITALVRERGTDAWFDLDVADLLPASLRDQAPRLVKGTDTMDVWFDSGSSWAGVVDGTAGLEYPADLYLEGSDQHRGWFQSSLLTSVAAQGRAPYRTVLTHGFVLDEKGNKMSKSLGNVVDPRKVIEGGSNQKQEPAYGADVLRLWISSVDYTSDVAVGDTILKQTFEGYRKLRGTVRFVLGNLSDFDAAQHAVPYADLPAVDRYVLQQTAALQEEARAAYENFQFYRVNQLLQKFCILDLSGFYLDVSKDRLYIQAPASFQRRACQTVLHHVKDTLLAIMAPILPHTAEDAWQSLGAAAPTASVFEAGWPALPAAWGEFDPADFERLLQVRGAVNRALEAARAAKVIGASLEARVAVHVADPALRERLEGLRGSANGVDELRYYFLVSQVDVVDAAAHAAAAAAGAVVVEAREDGLGEVAVAVQKATGGKCDRCWNYSATVGASAAHPKLCDRCVPVMDALGIAAEPKVEEAVPA